MNPAGAFDDFSRMLSEPGGAESLLTELALALLSPTPSPGQIILETAPDAEQQSIAEPFDRSVFLLDGAGVIVAVGGVAERVFGWPAPEIVGKPASTVLAGGESALKTLFGDPERAAEEVVPGLRGRRRDGSEFPLAARASRLTLGARRLVLLSIDDLGARLRREAARRKEAMRHRLLIEQIPAVTFFAAMDEGLNELYVSPQIETVIGFTQREWLENPILWFRQLHPDDRDVLSREFARGIATGGPFRAEVRVFAKDGRPVWVRGEGRLVRDAGGRPLFFQGIAFDVTESKRAEEQMRDAHDMKVRSARLAAIGQIAAGISHDLRNPLGAIRNAWYYLRRRLAASSLAESDRRIPMFSELIDRELARCTNIIGDLLDFARYRPPTRSPCAIRDVVREAFVTVVKLAPNVRFESDIPEDLPTVYLDATQIGQALVNLVQNAAEAVDPAKGSVRVSARMEGGAVVIDVTDDGPGIPADVVDKVFEPLFTTKAGGTGLGLAIVANVVRGHGGEVSVESAERRGTTFRLRVPTGAVEAGEPTAPG